MNKKKFLCYGTIFLILCLSFFIVGGGNSGQNVLIMEAYYKTRDEVQLYYGEDQFFSEEHSVMQTFDVTQNKMTFLVPKSSTNFRLDLGSIPDNIVYLRSIQVKKGDLIYTLSSEKLNKYIETLENVEIQNIQEFQYQYPSIRLDFKGNDPYLVFSSELFKEAKLSFDFNVKHILFVCLALIITVITYFYVYLTDVYVFVKNMVKQKALLFSLAKNDFKVKYAGSYLGFIWAFIQPICTILVFWFVFQIGFKSAPVSDVPFALWLATGLIPWFFFAESFSGATNTFFDYNYLVKKVVFQIEVLPMVKILSALFVHCFFLGFLLFLFGVNQVPLTADLIYLPYYLLCSVYLVVGLSFATSSIVVFFKDLSQIIAIALQFGMWLTPVMWDKSTFSTEILSVLKLNPVFYVIDGYRSAFLGTVTITLSDTIYFWTMSTFIFFLGLSLFRRLKVHFADVL